MTASDEPVPSSQPERPSARDANVDAVLWLARWLGIPFLILVGLYYAEPIFQPQRTAEFVQTVTRQEVYPYPGGSHGTSLAPTEVPRLKPLPFPPFPADSAPKPSGSEIVAHPVSQPQPVYPPRALELEREGTVRIRITIAADGTVSDATVTYAAPEGWFEKAALEAVRKWQYQPPGRTLVTETVIEFKLN